LPLSDNLIVFHTHRTVTVHLSDYSAPTVAEEFVRFLACLKNLENLQILSMAKEFDYRFQLTLSSKRLCLPSLVILVSPSVVVESLVRSSPNLKHLYIGTSSDQRYSTVISVISKLRNLERCSQLRTLECEGLSVWDTDSASCFFFKL
jgi:hypothetical protein